MPTEETVAKINAVTVDDIQQAAAVIFRAAPTLATMGPAGQVPDITRISEALAV